MSRTDTGVLRALQLLTLLLPLAHGGNHPIAIAVSAPLVLGMLLVTLHRRRQRPGPVTPGLAALVAFVGLALVTTVPLPAPVLAWLDPATAALTQSLLPGWPQTGGWSELRALAFDPYLAWAELVRLGVPIGAFTVLIAYPWATDDEQREVVTTLLLTVLVGGTLLALFGLAQLAIGNRSDARVSGPFVNPNHFAAWLEMLLPVALGYLATTLGRVGRGLDRSLASGRGMGMARHRVWLEAMVAQQQRLWAPLVIGGCAAVIGAAHLATGSRGGTAALLVGIAVTGAGLLQRTATTRGRWLVPTLLCGTLLLTIVTVGRWSLQDDANVEAADISLAARLAVAHQGAALVVDHPLFGVGLGSWLAAYRQHQAPPVEYGIWDHAHNDFLEVTAETGALGLALCLLFVVAVGRAVQRPAAPAPAGFSDQGFGAPDWWKDVSAGPGLTWGIAGGLAAITIHSLVDFSLRMPANLLLAAVLTGLWLCATPRPIQHHSRSLAVLTALLLIAGTPLVANQLLMAAGATPLSARDALVQADLALAEGTPTGDAVGRALIQGALDQAPVTREGHEMLVNALDPGPAREAALRRVIALQPWAPEARDQLALALWERGRGAAAAHELEESVARFPYLASHTVLLQTPQRDDPRAQLKRLADGDHAATRIATLGPALLDATARGLRRAMADTLPGALRAGTADDLIALLEARGDWAAAAATLWEEAEPTAVGATKLARAARNYLRVDDRASAEAALLAALRQNPDQGALYRMLAVDVYAARGDFPTADQVLAAGQANAIDMLPVYQAVTDVIARRERARVEQAVVSDGNPVARAPTGHGQSAVR